ncbi:MAG: Ig-like domain-containing protein [bacterium]|nr:Ig-like domain-containing protein [bacterium]
MKKYLVVTLALLVLVGASQAKVQELAVSVDTGEALTIESPTSLGEHYVTVSPMPLTEEELYNDNGVAAYHWSGGIAGFASKFVAPYDCRVVAVRLCCFNPSARNFFIDILGEDSGVPGKPDRNDSLLGGYETFYEGSHGGDTWVRFDLATHPLLSSGDVFFAMSDDSIEGQDNAPQDSQGPGPADSAWWYMGGSSWYDYDSFGAMLIRVFVDDDVSEPDTTPPFVADMEPTDGESDVPIDTDIVFHCGDDLSGVDTATIDFTVEDTTLGASLVVSTGSAAGSGASPAGVIAGVLDIDDSDLNDVVCTFTPDDPLPYEDTITCTVDGTLADLSGNPMGDDFIWSFTTEANPIGVVQTTWGTIKAEF